MTDTLVVDTTLDVVVEVKRNIQASGNHLIYSVILACVGEIITILTVFTSLTLTQKCIKNELQCS